jgi:hypothetical protein
LWWQWCPPDLPSPPSPHPLHEQALGLAHIKKDVMTASMEEQEADQLRLAVAESMCRSAEKRKEFQDAATAISFEMPIETYCKRILSPSFWGGEPELLVLAQILRRPIMAGGSVTLSLSTLYNFVFCIV